MILEIGKVRYQVLMAKDEGRKKNKNFKTTIGGQALIEGIMMRGPEKAAYVVRGPDGMVTRERKLKSPKEKFFLLRWPFIRGIFNFVGSMADGMKALTWSAEQIPEDEEYTPGEDEKQPSKFSLWLDRKLSSEKAQKRLMTAAVVFGIVLSVGVFMLLPAFLTGLLGGEALSRGIVRNLLEGLIRMVILVGYMALVSRMKDIKRVFSYHGAEHKTIACYEAGCELTVENVRGFSRFHPRCGTSFLFMVVIISILLFSLLTPLENMLLGIGGADGDAAQVVSTSWLYILFRVASRLILLPILVSITYEFNRIVGRFDNPLTRVLRAPGLLMQRMTTNEPDDSMIEVGIESLRLVIPREKGADEWGKSN